MLKHLENNVIGFSESAMPWLLTGIPIAVFVKCRAHKPFKAAFLAFVLVLMFSGLVEISKIILNANIAHEHAVENGNA
jgi:hypothetical protein